MIGQIEKTPEAQKKEDRVFSLSLGEGVKWGIAASVIVGAGTVAATYKHKKFNALTNMSTRMAIPIMSGLFVFSVKFENTMLDCNRHPENWGLKEYVDKGSVSVMPFHHKFMNYVHDHPFEMIAGLGIPFAGFMLKKNLALKHLTLSQKIMATRVYAQAGVLTILLITMGFREFMHKNGRFEEPDFSSESDNDKEQLK